MYETRSNLEEIYVMGHRLIAFYTIALPKHPHYRSIDPSISNLREKSLIDLDWIRKRLDVISLRIDEEQLNQYILREDNTTSSSTTTLCEARQDTDTHWESFSGWSSSSGEERPTLLATKKVSFAIASHGMRSSHEESVVDTSLLISFAKKQLPMEHVDDPGDILDLESDDDTSVDSDGDSMSADRAGDEMVSDEEYDSSFLRAIASEEVKFETDSDAVDSWAPDDSLDDDQENILYRYDSDERENVNPGLQSFPSFDEPADTFKGNALTASPQDVMSFDWHHRAGVRCSDEEPLSLHVSGLRI